MPHLFDPCALAQKRNGRRGVELNLTLGSRSSNTLIYVTSIYVVNYAAQSTTQSSNPRRYPAQVSPIIPIIPQDF